MRELAFVRRWSAGSAMLCGAALWGGCGDPGLQVRQDAAAGWNCPTDQVTIADADSGVYRVTGCGRSATYRCEAAGLDSRCKRLDFAWLDGRTRAVQKSGTW